MLPWAYADLSRTVTFPFGITGEESIEECGEILSGIFGEGEYDDSNEKFFMYVIPCDYDLYGMKAKRVAALARKDSGKVCYIQVSLVDDAKINGILNLMDIMLFAFDNYGNMFNSEPVKSEIDLNGNRKYYTAAEEMQQVEDALTSKQAFKYRANWMSAFEDYTMLFVIESEGNGTDNYYTTLNWSHS
jgi:hypothetical protein